MPTNRTLFVFLHGLTVVKNQGNMMEIVLPQVSGHSYLAGSWLRETAIDSGASLSLSGIMPGTKILGADPTNYTVSGLVSTLTGNLRAATLLLPPAKFILSLLRAQSKPPAFVAYRTNNPTVGWRDIATIQVIAYDYASENDIMLVPSVGAPPGAKGHYWEPCSIGGAISLHVVSTSLGPEDAQHYVDTEVALKQIVDNYPGVTLPQPVPIPAWSLPRSPGFGDLRGLFPNAAAGSVTDQGAFAFALAELEDIPSRQFRVERVGRFKQELRHIGKVWREPDPTGLQGSDCWTI